MTGPLIPRRVLRPDGTEAGRGPLLADVITVVERAEGRRWAELAAEGWRFESVPP